MTNDREYLEEGLSVLSTPSPQNTPNSTPSKPAVTWDKCRTVTQNSKARSKHTAVSCRDASSQLSMMCVVVVVMVRVQGGTSLKAISGTQLLSEGRLRCVQLCVFWGELVWPLSGSLHRESAAFHKCIKVSSERDKGTLTE